MTYSLATLGSASLLVLMVACSPSSSPPQAASSAPPEPAQAALPHTGQPIQLGDLAVTLQPIQLKERVGFDIAPQEAAEGGILVVVRYSVRNTGSKPVSAALLPDISLIDGKGQTYSPDAGKTGAYVMAAKTDSKVFSDLNPGITVKNARVFEVAKDAFDPATWVADIGGQKVALD